jgi:hypothetical protein
MPSIYDEIGYNPNTPYDKSKFGSGNYLGSDFGFLRGEYKKQLFGESDATKAYRDLGNKQAGMIAKKSLNAIEAGEGASGFLGTGANLQNEVFQNQALNLEQVNVNATQMTEQQRAQARQALFGMAQFEGSQNLNVDKGMEDVRQFDITTAEGRKQFFAQMKMKKRELDMTEEAQSGSFWETALGAIGGGLVGAFTGGVGAYAGQQAGRAISDWFN